MHQNATQVTQILGNFQIQTLNVDLFTIILTAVMHAFCFNTGRNQAKQHSSVVDWSWLNKNMKDRLLNCFILIILILSTLPTAPSKLNRPLSGSGMRIFRFSILSRYFTRPLLSGQHPGIYTRSMAAFMNFSMCLTQHSCHLHMIRTNLNNVILV